MTRPLTETLDEALARIKREKTIFCPWCDAIYEDEDGNCISYWGEDAPAGVICGHCDKVFEVHETVVRTYETKQITPTSEW